MTARLPAVVSASRQAVLARQREDERLTVALQAAGADVRDMHARLVESIERAITGLTTMVILDQLHDLVHVLTMEGDLTRDLAILTLQGDDDDVIGTRDTELETLARETREHVKRIAADRRRPRNGRPAGAPATHKTPQEGDTR